MGYVEGIKTDEFEENNTRKIKNSLSLKSS